MARRASPGWSIDRSFIMESFGEGLFQSIYPTPQSDIAAYLSSIEWVALTLFIFCLSIPLPFLRIVPYLMFGGTFLVALSYMIHAKLEPKHDTIRRASAGCVPGPHPAAGAGLVSLLYLAEIQAHASGGHRLTRAKLHSHPRQHLEVELLDRERSGPRAAPAEIIRALETEGWNYSTDTGWKDWDIQVYGSFWWGIKLRSVTEYHGGPKCLTRIKLDTQMVATTFLINLVLLAALFIANCSCQAMISGFGFLICSAVGFPCIARLSFEKAGGAAC